MFVETTKLCAHNPNRQTDIAIVCFAVVFALVGADAAHGFGGLLFDSRSARGYASLLY